MPTHRHEGTPSEGARPWARAAEKLFDSPRLYRLKFAVTGGVLRVTKPLLFRNYLSLPEILSSEIKAGSQVCEIGCGDGENYRVLRDGGTPVSFTGVDVNEHMISHCRARYPEATWHLQAGPPYPFVDGHFTVCVIAYVLHHLDDREQMRVFLREGLRVASRVLLVESLQSDNAWLRGAKTLYWALTDGGNLFLRLDELHALFEEAGAAVLWERPSYPMRHFYSCALGRR